MSSFASPSNGWSLEIDLDDQGRRRTVTLDFADRATLDRQLEQQLAEREATPFGRLMEFTNESGETLAIVAATYTTHRITKR
jgi:hypothetical protein